MSGDFEKWSTIGKWIWFISLWIGTTTRWFVFPRLWFENSDLWRWEMVSMLTRIRRLIGGLDRETWSVLKISSVERCCWHENYSYGDREKILSVFVWIWRWFFTITFIQDVYYVTLKSWNLIKMGEHFFLIMRNENNHFVRNYHDNSSKI